jgi:hypothetical protein
VIRPQYGERQFSVREVLLVTEVLVAGDQYFKSGMFGGIE